MSQMECTLLDQTYVLACPAGSEPLMRLAVQIVTDELHTIREAGKVKSRERMAVLAALNLGFQLAEKAIAAATPGGTGAAAAFLQASNSDAALVDALITKLQALEPPAPEPQPPVDPLPPSPTGFY